MSLLNIININTEYISDSNIYFEMFINIKTIEYLNFLFTRIIFDETNVNHQCSKTGKTLLMYAVEHNNYEYINKLLNKGAYLDIIDKKGRIARTYASSNKNWKIYELLYKKSYNNYTYDSDIENKNDYENKKEYDYSYNQNSSIPGSTGLNGFTIKNNSSNSNCNISSYNMSYYK